MGCGNKIKQTCIGNENYATCIQYELDLPEFSNITEDCYSLEETTEDTYELIGEIKSEIDLSELGENCLTYVQEDNKTLVKNVLLKYEEEICELKQQVENLQDGTSICNQSVIGCNINFGDLEDACGETITTLGEAIQAMANQINLNNQ